jgi:hypothetical protein
VKRERWIEIVNWEKFQHYRDREPVWIKNYTRLLHDDAYLALPLSTRGVLHGLWLERASANRVLSESETRRLLVANKSDSRYFQGHLERLNEAGFIRIRASKTQAKRLPREREREERSLGSEKRKREPVPDEVKSWLRTNRK